MDLRRRAIRGHQRTRRRRCRRIDVSLEKLARQRVEGHRTARANHLDGVSSWRPSRLVSLHSLFQWSILWAPRRAALLSGRTIRVSVLLRADLCEPTRRLAPPRALIREQAFGEAFDAGKLESLGRYEVHLDRAVLLVPDDLAALERIATVAQKEMIVAFLEVFSDAPTLGLVDPAVGPTWGDLMPLQQRLAKQKSRNPKASANTKSVISIQQQCTFGREMIGD
jgi:hypothetical protein